MTTETKETKPPISLRLVRGDSDSVSISGSQFRLWPPGKLALLFVLLLVVIGIGIYALTIGRLNQYEADFREQERRMESYRLKVMQLETNLIKAQEMVAQVAEMAGVKFEYTPLYEARDTSAEESRIGVAGAKGFYPRNLGIPFGLPLEGFISRGYQVSAGGQAEHYHPGVDIAVAVGVPILATASGEVIFAGEDEIYGLTVVVRHNDSLSTLYGHNSKLLVSQGSAVIAGARLALSGNTGISSAPHLHYEIQINDSPVDPSLFLGGID